MVLYARPHAHYQLSKSRRAPHPYMVILMLLFTRGLCGDGEHARVFIKIPTILPDSASRVRDLDGLGSLRSMR